MLPSLRSACSTAVLSNHRWLTLADSRTAGVDVEVGADAEQDRAGIVEVRLALLLRRAQSEFRMPLRPLIETARPPPAKGIDWRIQ